MPIRPLIKATHVQGVLLPLNTSLLSALRHRVSNSRYNGLVPGSLRLKSHYQSHPIFSYHRFSTVGIMIAWSDCSVSFHIAEAAQMLTRNVNYEVPALKKQVVKCKKSQQDCTRKEGEYNSLASELKKKYYDMCQQFGIQVCRHIQKSSVLSDFICPVVFLQCTFTYEQSSLTFLLVLVWL